MYHIKLFDHLELFVYYLLCNLFLDIINLAVCSLDISLEFKSFHLTHQLIVLNLSSFSLNLRLTEKHNQYELIMNFDYETADSFSKYLQNK